MFSGVAVDWVCVLLLESRGFEYAIGEGGVCAESEAVECDGWTWIGKKLSGEVGRYLSAVISRNNRPTQLVLTRCEGELGSNHFEE